MNDKNQNIFRVYMRSNICVWNPSSVSDEIKYKNLWLAAMGMMETLIIMGVNANSDG